MKDCLEIKYRDLSCFCGPEPGRCMCFSPRHHVLVKKCAPYYRCTSSFSDIISNDISAQLASVHCPEDNNNDFDNITKYTETTDDLIYVDNPDFLILSDIQNTQTRSLDTTSVISNSEDDLMDAKFGILSDTQENQTRSLDMPSTTNIWSIKCNQCSVPITGKYKAKCMACKKYYCDECVDGPIYFDYICDICYGD
ncbi:unnamed protein product [Parnassius apollo]|uniref:(apollo) hypothetical protein n=1 Tax=Parnassius apollo TaxID=110799 RepID=A0A8S3XC28_PARAO|nr:unnamed protein product [Parnassius apollo]